MVGYETSSIKNAEEVRFLKAYDELSLQFLCTQLLSGDRSMYTLAQTLYLDSSFGVEQELPHAGSSLENPYVFDASARELKAMASKGLVEIIEERARWVASEQLIDRLRFKRLRERQPLGAFASRR